MLPRIGESTDPWVVPISGRLNSSPSSTPHVQALADEPQQRPIRDPSLEHLGERGAIHAVEKGHDVCLQNPTHFALMNDPVQGSHGVMGTASGPEAIRAVQEVLLIDRLDNLAQSVLHELVL